MAIRCISFEKFWKKSVSSQLILDSIEINPKASLLKYERIKNGYERTLIVKNINEEFDYGVYTVKYYNFFMNAKLTKIEPPYQNLKPLPKYPPRYLKV